MNNTRRIATLCISLSLALGLLLLSLSLPRIVSASGPGDGSGHQGGRGVIGVASSALKCLAVGGGVPTRASGVVELTWQGQAERARLVLSVAGTEASHRIRVNGYPVALVPIYPGGRPCSAENYLHLDVPPEVLRQGDNLIEITNDALSSDGWTAANVRLEVFGDVTNVQVGRSDGTGQGTAGTTAAPPPTIFTFTNTYDGSSQEAIAQQPDGYDGNTPVPLLIYAHGRSGVMEAGIDLFGSAANDKGWLLASPEMHGSWPIPDICYEDPDDPECEYDDRTLLDKPGAFAYASLESQYDIIGTVNYMVNNYKVKVDQIYLAGRSMGGQIDTVTAAKYPHIFAAVFDNKGPTDMYQWHDENSSYYQNTMRKECHIGGDPKAPGENPFCYQRRSSVHFASNYIHVPISITHSISDTVVPIHHARELRDAINAYDPDWPASVLEDSSVTCAPDYHCYEPDSMAVLDFLDPFTLNSNPSHVNITTDESKTYYWLNLAQTGGDHWSRVEVAYYPIGKTVTATISDTQPLAVGFNLGSTPMMDIIEQPGMGLPATTYLVRGGGVYALADYASGYLTTTLADTGRFTLTISAVEADVAADPAMILGGHAATSTITAVFRDHLDNPVPDGTIVQFSTSEGVFPNMSSTYTAAATGGQATATLTLPPTTDLAEISAGVESVVASTSVDAIHPQVDVRVTPSQMMVRRGQTVTFTYQLTNTGDITLTAVTLVDDNGTPGDGSDDHTICENISLAADATASYHRSATLDQHTTITATVTGQGPLGNGVTASGAATVRLIYPAIDLSVAPHPTIIRAGDLVTYTYQITNTGDVTLTAVTLVDDNGTPGDSSDDHTICENVSMTVGATASYRRSAILNQHTTITATVTGQDPLGYCVTKSAAMTVVVGMRVYLPIVARSTQAP
jgi:dienelactone hydrolase